MSISPRQRVQSVEGLAERERRTQSQNINTLMLHCYTLTPRVYFLFLPPFHDSRGPRVGWSELRVCVPWPFVPNVVRQDDEVKPAKARGRVTLQPRSRGAKGRGRRLIARKASDTTAKRGHGQAARARLRGGRDRRTVGRLQPTAEASIVAGGVEHIGFVLVGSASERVRRHAVHNPPRTQRVARAADDGRLGRELTNALAQLRPAQSRDQRIGSSTVPRFGGRALTFAVAAASERPPARRTAPSALVRPEKRQ